MTFTQGRSHIGHTVAKIEVLVKLVPVFFFYWYLLFLKLLVLLHSFVQKWLVILKERELVTMAWYMST